MKKYITEFIGTFFLVFAGTGAIIVNQISGGAITHLGIAITFGLVVMAMIYAIGDISGAHMNPAVTIAFYIKKEISSTDCIGYVISQIIGAIVASYVSFLLYNGKIASLGATLPSGTDMQSFIMELILTFFLMFVILGVSTGAKEKGVLAGIAIGATVALEAAFGGPISGASMNPARSIGPALVSGNLNSLWVYIVAPILGAILASIVFSYIKE